jgi:hypothetical protein
MTQTLSHATTEDHTEIVFGADVIMTKTNGEITLHAPGGNGREVIGRYASTADAWSALDELDAPLDDLVYRAA